MLERIVTHCIGLIGWYIVQHFIAPLFIPSDLSEVYHTRYLTNLKSDAHCLLATPAVLYALFINEGFGQISVEISINYLIYDCIDLIVYSPQKRYICPL